MNDSLPPIHDAVRLWDKSDTATLRSCIAFRKRKRPGWTLAFLREKAPYIFNGELKEHALRQAVEQYVPSESQKSVLHGLDLLLRFIKKHDWHSRKAIPTCDLVYEGLRTQLRPVGVYESKLLNKKFVIALQPRLEDVPTNEQFRIWLSAIQHRYCNNVSDNREPMIVDLAKNLVSGKRELREITKEKIELLDQIEFDGRLTLVARNYKKAIEIVPELPERPPPKQDRRQKKLL